MKAYLLVYGGGEISREEFARVLDECQAISDWRSDLPFCFYLHSTQSATDIATCIKLQIGGQTRVFVSEVSDNSDGYITKDSWYFLFAPEEGDRSTLPADSVRDAMVRGR